MPQFVTTVVAIASAVLPMAIALGMIGVVIGLAMSIIGFRHGSKKA